MAHFIDKSTLPKLVASYNTTSTRHNCKAQKKKKKKGLTV